MWVQAWLYNISDFIHSCKLLFLSKDWRCWVCCCCSKRVVECENEWNKRFLFWLFFSFTLIIWKKWTFRETTRKENPNEYFPRLFSIQTNTFCKFFPSFIHLKNNRNFFFTKYLDTYLDTWESRWGKFIVHFLFDFMFFVFTHEF